MNMIRGAYLIGWWGVWIVFSSTSQAALSKSTLSPRQVIFKGVYQSIEQSIEQSRATQSKPKGWVSIVWEGKNPKVYFKDYKSKQELAVCQVINWEKSKNIKPKSFEMECQSHGISALKARAFLTLEDHGLDSDLRFGSWLTGYSHYRIVALKL